jgi:hypothetical protein
MKYLPLLIYGKQDLKRALLLSCIVGSWLVALNQGSAIIEGQFVSILYLRIFLDYATPFAVSSLTSCLRNRSDMLADLKAKRGRNE